MGHMADGRRGGLYCFGSGLLVLMLLATSAGADIEVIHDLEHIDYSRVLPFGFGLIAAWNTFYYVSAAPASLSEPSSIYWTTDLQTMTPLLDSEDRSCSVSTVVDGALYVMGAGACCTDKMTCPDWPDLGTENFPSPLGESKLWRSTNASDWTELTLPPELKYMIPAYLFGFQGVLYLQCGPAGIEGDLQTQLNFWITNECAHGCGPDMSRAAFYRSTDSGQSWSEVTSTPWEGSLIDGFSTMLWIDVTFAGRKFVLTTNDVCNPTGAAGHAYTSTDGTNWTEADIVPDADECVTSMLVFHDTLYALASGGLYGSGYPMGDGFTPDDGPTLWESNDGATWAPVTSRIPHTAELFASSTVMVACEPVVLWPQFARNVYYTLDGPTWFTWDDRPTGYDSSTVSPAYASYMDNNYLYLNYQWASCEPTWEWHSELCKVPMTDFTVKDCAYYRELFDGQWSDLSSDYGLDPDVDGDGLPEQLALRLVAVVLCDDLYPYHDDVYEAYTHNLHELDNEGPAIEPYKECLAALLLIGMDVRDFFIAELGLTEIYDVFTDSGKLPNEPFSGTGDLDEDGYSNAEEWAQVCSWGGTIDDFVNAATNSEWSGEPVPVAGGLGLALAALACAGIGARALTRKARRQYRLS